MKLGPALSDSCTRLKEQWRKHMADPVNKNMLPMLKYVSGKKIRPLFKHWDQPGWHLDF